MFDRRGNLQVDFVFFAFNILSKTCNITLNSEYFQLVDFRFAKKLESERTFTICGIAEFLSPEILQGKGHGIAADW